MAKFIEKQEDRPVSELSDNDLLAQLTQEEQQTAMLLAGFGEIDGSDSSRGPYESTAEYGARLKKSEALAADMNEELAREVFENALESKRADARALDFLAQGIHTAFEELEATGRIEERRIQDKVDKQEYGGDSFTNIVTGWNKLGSDDE